MKVNFLEDHLIIDDYFNSLREEYRLTRKESEVLQKLSLTGMSNEELGRQLNITEKSMINYINNIIHKMGANSFRHVQAIVLQKTLPPIFLTAINPETNTRVKREKGKLFLLEHVIKITNKE